MLLLKAKQRRASKNDDGVATEAQIVPEHVEAKEAVVEETSEQYA